jgi:hypothetical protein
MCYTSGMLAPTLASARTVEPLMRPQGRRRGGQPGNHNARTHGFYAAAPRPPAVHIRARLDSVAAAPQSNLDLLQVALNRADRLMSDALDLMETSRQPMFGLGCIAFSGSLSLFARISILKFRLALPKACLLNLARHTSWLIDWEFRRITEYPIFVPLTLRNSDANSSSGGPVLTDAQWLLLKDLFGSLHADLDAKRRYRRHKPLPDDRLLLRAILLKLAFGLRWCDLATFGFDPRLCRARYRQLYLSGRMSAIYTHLHRHLVAHGDTRLQDLVQQGCFQYQPHRIRLSPGQRLTWQKFTALLLLQRAQHSQRALARKSDLLRRRGGAYLRFPLPRLSRSTTVEIPSTGAVSHPSTSRSAQAQNAASVDVGERGSVCRFKPVLEAIVSPAFP